MINSIDFLFRPVFVWGTHLLDLFIAVESVGWLGRPGAHAFPVLRPTWGLPSHWRSHRSWSENVGGGGDPRVKRGEAMD